MEETTKRILLMVMVMIPIRDQLGGTITEFTILLVVCHEDDVIITKMSCSIPLRLFITRKTTQLPNRPKRWKRPQQPNRKATQLPTRNRSEERRVGKEVVSTRRSRWCPCT